MSGLTDVPATSSDGAQSGRTVRSRCTGDDALVPHGGKRSGPGTVTELTALVVPWKGDRWFGF